MTLKSHTFNSGNQLVLDDTTSFVGFHGLTVYTVSYMEQDDNGNFEPCNKDVYMSEAVAIAGYEERLISDYPFHVLKKCIGISDIIIESFNKYLDGGSNLAKKPATWDTFATQTLNESFGENEGCYYDDVKIKKALHNLNTIETENSVILEIPDWKLLELLTAITALAQMVRLEKTKDRKGRPLSA